MNVEDIDTDLNVYACSCDGCWACTGHVIDCTCDINWDELTEARLDGGAW